MNGLAYLDVCAGISAPTVAWSGLGWRALAYAETAAAPRAVLAYHYPEVPLVGDFTRIEGTEYGAVDLVVGGTPCQSYSIAGLRAGLADDRGDLALQFLALAARARARWFLWENVPGVLSSHRGRDFAAIVARMVECGYGVAWRVLDAQYAGVPQRRRRLFVVGHLGDWRRAAAVLFERESFQGHPPPSRGAGAQIAGSAGAGADPGSGELTAFGGNNTAGPIETATAVRAHGGPHGDFESETFLVANSLRGEGFDASEDGAGRGTPLVPVAFTQNSRGEVRAIGGDGQIVGALHSNGGRSGQVQNYLAATAVRRLTPRECERLQGLPDDYTLVPFRRRMMRDAPRYRMVGNSMAVPVIRWIGERIQMVEQIRRSDWADFLMRERAA